MSARAIGATEVPKSMLSRLGVPPRSLTTASDPGPSQHGSKRFAPSSGSTNCAGPPSAATRAMRQRFSRWRATAIAWPLGDQRGRANDVSTSPVATSRTAPVLRSTMTRSQWPPGQRSATARRPSGAGSASRSPALVVRRRTACPATSHRYSSGRKEPSERRVERQRRRRLPSGSHRGSSYARPSRATSVDSARFGRG